MSQFRRYGYCGILKRLSPWEAHGGADHKLQPKDFHMEVVEAHQYVLRRQIQEGTLLSSELTSREKERRKDPGQARMVLNSWTEFHQPGLIQPRPAKILY